MMIQAVLQNIYLNPKEDKFRKLKLGNLKLKENILNVQGAIELMTFLGFIKTEEYFYLERKCLKCELCQKVAKELLLLKDCMESIDNIIFQEYGNLFENPNSEELEKSRKRMLEESRKKKEILLKKKEKEEIMKKIGVDQKERKETQKDTLSFTCKRPTLKGGKVTTFRDVGIDLNQSGG